MLSGSMLSISFLTPFVLSFLSGFEKYLTFIISKSKKCFLKKTKNAL